ncbi:hypothetical protein [Tateyamaria sp. SN3-11]|uniref:hypothetical protein n=1 Tax=Tateyamaria sp. SN3-11 TaxID=3092147 RepID=UPI0039EA49B4
MKKDEFAYCAAMQKDRLLRDLQQLKIATDAELGEGTFDDLKRDTTSDDVTRPSERFYHLLMTVRLPERAKIAALLASESCDDRFKAIAQLCDVVADSRSSAASDYCLEQLDQITAQHISDFPESAQAVGFEVGQVFSDTLAMSKTYSQILSR